MSAPAANMGVAKEEMWLDQSSVSIEIKPLSCFPYFMGRSLAKQMGLLKILNDIGPKVHQPTGKMPTMPDYPIFR